MKLCFTTFIIQYSIDLDSNSHILLKCTYVCIYCRMYYNVVYFKVFVISSPYSYPDMDSSHNKLHKKILYVRIVSILIENDLMEKTLSLLTKRYLLNKKLIIESRPIFIIIRSFAFVLKQSIALVVPLSHNSSHLRLSEDSYRGTKNSRHKFKVQLAIAQCSTTFY